jgi:HD-GYP domain-containing protein (c-di-GMP phosphodiesterase class II)
MKLHSTVNLGNMVLSLSNAMDLASPALIQHQQRVAYVAWRMGRAAGHPHERLERTFIAALLHDIGAFSLEEKFSLRSFEVDNIEDHCLRGEMLLREVPWLKESALLIRHHHREWQQWDEPIENRVVLDSQLLCLADYLERLIRRDEHILQQSDDIVSTIRSHSGDLFHPDAVELFLAVCYKEEFWLDLVSPRLFSQLLNNGPFRTIEVDLSGIRVISKLYRNIIDFQSRFTSTHSAGVAAAASTLARLYGLTETEAELMAVAGDLHDLGKLAIPNAILDKPGALSKQEMALVRSHSYYTYSVISSIGGFQPIAEWAAYHHERLDGSGYPFHCKAGELSTGARIMMIADIFTALTEDRPYRAGMPRVQVVSIIKDLVDRRQLDGRVAAALFDNYHEVSAYVSEWQAAEREFYEEQFRCLDDLPPVRRQALSR